MEQEERDNYPKGYSESSERARKALGEFMKKISVELVGTHAENWLTAIETLAKIEKPNQGLLDALAKFLPKPAEDLYLVSVDYGRSIEDGIRAGNYHYANPDITAHYFPTNRTGVREEKIELIHFGEQMSTKNVLNELETRGLRPANLHELLVFGEKYPKIQREFPIVALGSVCGDRLGDCHVPCLNMDGVGRDLSLDLLGGEWGNIYRFAAVRK